MFCNMKRDEINDTVSINYNWLVLFYIFKFFFSSLCLEMFLYRFILYFTILFNYCFEGLNLDHNSKFARNLKFLIRNYVITI